MKKIKIIARENIINPLTNNRHDDVGLRALNGYYEELMELNCEIDAIKLKNKITEKYPEMEHWEFEITEI